MYDQVALDAWKPYGPKTQVWGVLQGGYESSEWKNFSGRDWFGDRFMFIQHGQLHARKNVYCSIQAFNELKHEHPDSFSGARLGLHTTVNDPLVVFGDLIPGMKVWHEMWEKPVLEEFYHAAHVLLAPSRGEGKNLPALEMMSTGGAVAATAWGGHMGWMNPEYAYPLDYELTPTDPRYPDQSKDAKVSVETMKDFMWHAFNNRAEVKQKAELAANVIPKMMDWSVVVENLFRRIRDLVPGKGEVLYNKSQACRKE
jgi:glycosyltransferase involved in cell wall biosynthesis